MPLFSFFSWAIDRCSKDERELEMWWWDWRESERWGLAEIKRPSESANSQAEKVEEFLLGLWPWSSQDYTKQKKKILLLPTLWIGNLLLLACVIPSSNASLPSDHTHAHCFACKSIVCPVTETVWTHVLSTFVITKYFLLLFGFMYSRSVIFDRENNETLLDWRKQMFDREPFFQTDRSVC